MKITTISKPTKENKDFVSLIESGDYFSEMDFAIQNSPTASMAVLMFKKYCKLPNLKPQYQDLWNKIIYEKSHYGFFTIWAKYNVDLQLQDIYYRKSKNYRVKQQDDTGNSSSFLNSVTSKIFPTFNNNKSILKNQIAKAGGFQKFSGQIFQYNSTANEYEISPLFSVFNWMKIEFDTPNHISASADNSLFGNNLFIMRKSSETQTDDNGEVIISNTDKVISALKKGKGSKNSGSNFVLEVDTEDELKNIITSIPIGNSIDVDKFNLVDDKAAKKICTAFYCFPQILANPSEGLFGNSGESYKQAINFWRETCEFEAQKIKNAILEMGIDLEETIVEEIVEEIEIDQATKDAQANLKGSVGGVQALLQIQTSYATELTTYESAIAMLKFIFGFTPEQAVELLGVPKIVPINQPTLPTT